jgi:signal transduction histidine kinase/CheY-like chemotaxis protein
MMSIPSDRALSSAPSVLREASTLSFLAGGGQMGERMRALDWSKTALGAPECWPQSLKTIVRVMLDSRYAMWMLWGPELTFFCNDSYLPTVGNKRDWVLGARSDKVWEEIWPDIGPRIAQVLEQGKATWDEGLQLFLDRRGFLEETYHTFSYSPVYDDDSRVAGMLCVVTEVTERVIGEQRLKSLRDLADRTLGLESVEGTCQRLFDVLAQYSQDFPFAALYLLEDKEPRWQCVAHTMGLDAEALIARLAGADSPSPLRELLQKQIRQQISDLPQRGISIPAIPWREPAQHAVLLPLKSSGPRHLAGMLVVGTSVRRPLDDAYLSFLELVARQITTAIADAQAFEAQRLRAEALAEIDRAKTTFFSNVSHEFRTPLTLMLGPVEEAIADYRLPEDIRGKLDLVQRNSLRLLRLVNSLLDFARIEAGRLQASFEPTDLAALTRDLASTFRSAVERAGLKFVVDCADLVPSTYVDIDMWEKVVLNLLSNALKFTFAGQIEVRLRAEEAQAVLTVTDTGIGIEEQELTRVFERFHRVDGARSRTQEGSGIGLALVHELLKLHAATIDVASSPGRGTTFRVTLPFGMAHLPPERVHAARDRSFAAVGAQAFVQEALRWLPDEQATAVSSGTSALAGTSGTIADPRFLKTFGSRVILADDNADMRAYVRELLGRIYTIEAVADGELALASARRQRPDLIITDVMMPRMDGFGLLAAIRRDESLQSVPVVLLSARAGEEARIEGFDAGADDYLIKPFSARELIARVGALLELGTMRREAEHALRLRTAQFETLFNKAPLGMYVVDADFRLRDVNPTALPVFGDIPNLIGEDFEKVMRAFRPGDYGEEVVRAFRSTLETGEPFVMPEHGHRREDQHTVDYFEWQIHRIVMPDGSHGVVCYFRDISVHVLARIALQDADRQKDEFLAMLAHELRNPLAPIQNASTLLAAITQDEPRAQASVGVIQRQVRQLARLVDDLLDVSRITRGRIELKSECLELGSIVAQALEVVDAALREKHQRVSISTHDGALPVLGDNARLVQCVGNILNNSAKYTDVGGEISIRSWVDGSQAVLEINDTGAGIAADLLPRVFDLFVQSERTLDRSQGGLGIGLSVVKKLVEMHGGKVTASSGGIGQGATFEIRLPLLQHLETSADRHLPLAVPSKRILIVDDNADAADTMALLLEFDGHQTKTVYGSSEALGAAIEFRPDTVLLDIGLPGMNGYEIAERLRAMPELSAVRLIALTGYGKAEDQERAKAAGFDDHLVKPVDLADLMKTLART